MDRRGGKGGGRKEGKGERRKKKAHWLLTALVQERHKSFPSESASLSAEDVRGTWSQTPVLDLDTCFSLLAWLLCFSLEGVGERDGCGPALRSKSFWDLLLMTAYCRVVVYISRLELRPVSSSFLVPPYVVKQRVTSTSSGSWGQMARSGSGSWEKALVTSPMKRSLRS